MPTADEVFARHHRDLRRYLVRMTGRAQDADDLLQEVFVRVVASLRNGGPVGHERGWVFSIARNLLVDRYRSQRPEVGLEAQAEPAVAGTQDLALDLAQALACLAAADREVFLLREVGGLSYGEIAVACHSTGDGVRGRLHRARMTLRELLDPEGRRSVGRSSRP